MLASMCTGDPPGAVTMVSPKPMVPFGLTTAMPAAAAREAAPPHWSSKPSSW